MIPPRPFALACGALLLLLPACARRVDLDRIPPMKVLVMDLELPPGMRDNPREIRGWWLGARTVYQNPRAGALMAEQLHARLARFPFLNLFSRTDLKYYFARKRQLLNQAYDHLEDHEIDELLRQIPPSSFAEELGADKVISGRILEDRLDANRTFHWWSSRVHLRCQATDARTGRIEWEREYNLKKRFASQLAAQEALADRVAKDLLRDYFAPLARPANP